jgi:predicted TIM-barrel fold metal-dependent hydrolase
MGITRRQLETTIDQDWAAEISALVRESDLDYAAVLGFDAVYDRDGRLDLAKSQLIVPHRWVFEVCERYSNLLPAPSINPYRRDALDILDEAIDRGAVLIKWLPIVQDFDPASERARGFLRRVADAKIPLLVHAGTGEVTFRTVDPDVGNLEGLVPALEMGVTIICAHTAAPIHFPPERSQLDTLRRMLERYPRLWVDNSGLANPARCRHLPRFARDATIADRTLHGSDFPIPSSVLYYLPELGQRQVRAIQAERNPFQREVVIKRSLGFGEDTFTRAAGVIANLERWTGPGAGERRPGTGRTRAGDPS